MSEKTLREVEKIFHSIFDDTSIVLTEEMTTDDISDWNSLTHMEVLCEIENQYGIKFSSREIRSFQCVGDMVSTIDKKLGVFYE